MIIPTENQSLLIQWNHLKDTGEYFSLFKSTSPESGFEPVLINKKVGSFIDKDVNLFEIGKHYYYKLEIANDDKTIIRTVGPERSRYNKMNGEARAMIREFTIVLRVMKNPIYKLLLKKRSGIYCPECYNTVTKKPSFAGCKRCNGTGKLEGYHDPVNIRLSKDISRETEYSSMLDSERVKLTNNNAWTTPYPRITPGDVIVDVLNQRYRVVDVSPRTHAHVLIRQVLQLVPLERGHPAYNREVWFNE